MATAATKAKQKYNEKAYKQFAVRLKPELFDELETIRAEAGMSRSEFLTWALEQWKKQGR